MTNKQYVIVKALTSEILHSVTSPTKFCAQRIFCRGSDRYFQIITQRGVITAKSNIKGDCPLELGKVYGIGEPDKWKKFTKGAIVSDDTFEPAANQLPHILKIAESCATGPVALLNSTKPLAPFYREYDGVITDGESALVWLSGSCKAGMQAVGSWTKSPESVHPNSCGYILPWVHQMLNAMPEDAETGKLEQLTGASVAYIAGPVGIRLVFRELGIVISIPLAPDERSVSYTLNGKTFGIQSHKDGTFEPINKEGGVDMNINVQDVKKATPLFDPTVLNKPVNMPETKVAETAAKPVVDSVTPEEYQKHKTTATPDSVKQELQSAQKAMEATQQVAAAETDKAPQPEPTLDELLEKLTEKVEANLTEAKELKSALIAVKKQLRIEMKSAKTAKLTDAEKEELAELRAFKKRVQALMS